MRAWHQCPGCRRTIYECKWCNQVHSFTPRTMESFTLLAQGKTNDQIADAMVMIRKSAETYIDHIFRELPCLNGQKRVMACIWYQEHVVEGDDFVKEDTRWNGHLVDANGDGLRRGNTADPNGSSPYVYPYPYAH